MTIGKVIDRLIKEYLQCKDDEIILKPLSFALYKTWQWADRKEKMRWENDD